jgi:hypothetical protein
LHECEGWPLSQPKERRGKTKSSRMTMMSLSWGEGSSEHDCSIYGDDADDEVGRRIADEEKESEMINLALELSLHEMSLTSTSMSSEPGGINPRERGRNGSINGPSSGGMPRQLPLRAASSFQYRPPPIEQLHYARASHLGHSSHSDGLYSLAASPSPIMSNLEVLRRRDQEMLEQALENSMHELKTETTDTNC